MGWGLIGDGMGWGPEVTRELVQDEGVIHGVGRDAGVGHTARGGRRGCPGVTGAAMAQPPPPRPPTRPTWRRLRFPQRRSALPRAGSDERLGGCTSGMGGGPRARRQPISAQRAPPWREIQTWCARSPARGFGGHRSAGPHRVRFSFSVTNGGKTTLTNKIVKALPNCCVIHQDDFFKVGAAGTPTCGGVCVWGASAAPRSGSREIPLLLPSGVLQCDTCTGGNAALGAVEYGARGALGLMDH